MSRNTLNPLLFSLAGAEDGLRIGNRDVDTRIGMPGVHERAGWSVLLDRFGRRMWFLLVWFEKKKV
jgi:hypothetical protein